jgi:NADPH2 dehydrogenase
VILNGIGIVIVMQLWALGRAAVGAVLQKEGTKSGVVSSSNIALEGSAEVVRALSVEEIAEYNVAYGVAAKAFVEGAGGDGVELHAGNGYLIDQFTQTNSNKRTDNYGGSAENRCRFALEAMDSLVKAVGPEKVGIRLSPFS